LRGVIEEYVSHRRDIRTVDDESAGKPNIPLFKKILSAQDSRKAEIEEIFRGHAKSDRTKEAEPLLKAIIICGIAEILVHTDIDKALIINDYLNVSHSFYDQKQVSFVNGILDSVAKLLRS
jgi:transcription antitermination protein NusB